MISSIRVRFSQLAIPRQQCKQFIQQKLQAKDTLCVKVINSNPESDHISYMPLTLLHQIRFLTMEDISTPTSQRLIGRLILHGEELRYILANTSTDVVLFITPKDNSSLVTTRIVLPLSMDCRTNHAIHVPSSFSKTPNTIPNEITWEFLNELYTPRKFPNL